MVGGGSVLGLSWMAHKSLDRECVHHLENIAKNAKLPIHEVYGEEASNYPWNDLRLSNTEDWEFRRVRLFGTFGPALMFVRRERRGKPGYLIFAPFYTAHQVGGEWMEDQPAEIGKPIAHLGMMVCIGWTPAGERMNHMLPGAKVAKAVKDFEPLHAKKDDFEEDNQTEFIVSHDGTVIDPFPVDGNEREIVAVEGFLRRGETKSLLKGRWSDDATDQQNQINLRRMLRVINFSNMDTASEWYLERAVDHLPNKSLVIVPQTYENAYKSVEDTTKHTTVYQNTGKLRWIGGMLMALGILI